MPIITLPNGSKKVFEKSVTILEIAKSIGAGLAKATIAGKVNDVLLDATIPINKDSEVVIITSKDKEGIEIIRHSFAHLIGHAVKQIYPNIKMAIGPVIEDGFYYDIFSEYRFTPEDLIKIENRINKLIKTNYDVEILQVSKEEAIKTFKERDETFKLKIIEEIPEKGLINLYKHEEYIDMCRGPHVPNTRHLRHFKLLKLSGSYWRGNSENESLQRIYGTAWAKEKELNDYLKRIEEAEKRDHRKLGKEMDLFHFREESPGSVFWHQKGWNLFQKLIYYMRDKQNQAGYQEINTPEILDRSLWEKSGHWDKFGANMFTSTTPDKKVFAIKPMNCPGCVQVFNQGLKSYRDLPLKMSEFGKVHRYEPSGALHGLLRVRAFTQDDAHIFCTENQITGECLEVTKLILDIYRDLGFKNIILKYSDRPDIRVGEDEVWDKSEEALLKAIKKTNLEYSINKGEGAFYGPKIEFVLRDAIGRDWQCGTLQVDLNLPARLGASYVDKDGSKKVPVMLHRALFGSLERFIGILIENYSGKLPFWISPLQIVVIPISEDFDNYAKKVNEELKQVGISSEIDLKNHNLNYKIREHSLKKIPILIICGKKEVDSNTVTIRKLDSNKQENMDFNKFKKKYSILSKSPSK